MDNDSTVLLQQAFFHIVEKQGGEIRLGADFLDRSFKEGDQLSLHIDEVTDELVITVISGNNQQKVH